jgi:predicted DNA binding protein
MKPEVTIKALQYKKKENISLDALAEKLGITKMTLYQRMKRHNWKVTEVFFINHKLK